MKIFLTGSTGMVGQEVMRVLKGKHTIVECSRARGIDISDKDAVEKAMKGCGIVIHAAAILDENAPEEEIHRVNVKGTQNVLSAARKNKVKQFIHLSSVGVYGDAPGKKREGDSPTPTTAYERSKVASEEALKAYAKDFAITIVRPAIVIGPNRFWKQIFKMVHKGFPLIGNGKNAWQMIHVADLAEFVKKCVGNPKAKGKTFNVAEKEAHTLREVVDMIADVEKVPRVPSIPKFVGMGAGYGFLFLQLVTGKNQLLIPAHVKRMFKHREYDISNALSTGWKPTHTTKEAIARAYMELFPEGLN